MTTPQRIPPAAPPETAKPATLKTLAELTGLSLSTVSLALRGGAALKAETRERVLEAAKQVGYVPDRAGVKLRTGKSNVIALVLHNSGQSVDFTRAMLAGVGKGLAHTPYHLMVSPEFEDGDSIDAVRYILENRAADGLILTHTTPRDARVKLLMTTGLPFVCHGRTQFAQAHAFHDFHSEAFVRMAVERLAARGCRSLLLAQVASNTMSTRLTITAFEAACAAAGLKSTVHGGDVFSTGGFETIRRFGHDMAHDPDRPDGVVCTGEMFAMTLLSSLRDEGVVVGRDIKLVCKETTDLMSRVFPNADGIIEDVFAAGVELVRLLLARLDGAEPPTLQTLGEPIPRWAVPAHADT